MRRVITGLVVALLLLPAWDAAISARRNNDLWSRLRARGRIPPDTGWDREYRQLVAYLPPDVPVGLLQVHPEGTPTRERQYYYLQYSLAPRLVMPGADAEFVVVHAAPAAAATLIDPAAFTPIRDFGGEFVLYRRTAPR